MTYNQLTQEEFIIQCNNTHNNEYDYSLTKYTNTTQKIKILCKKHGIFIQVADHHKRGSKCPECRGFRQNTESFILKSISIHDLKYDYSLVDYKNNRTPVKIICKKHGIFEQIPKHHLTGSGCPNCKSSHGESKIIKILDDYKIKYKKQKTFDGCKTNKKLQFDFYLIDYNICIEFDGKQHFVNVEWFGGSVAFERRKILDKVKNNFCLKNNIELVRVRYDENILDKLSFLKYL